MRTVRLIVKRSLLGLFGLMVYAALGFSSNVPSSLRMARDEDGLRAGEPLRLCAKSSRTTWPTTSSGRELKPSRQAPKLQRACLEKGIATHPSTDHNIRFLRQRLRKFQRIESPGRGESQCTKQEWPQT